MEGNGRKRMGRKRRGSSLLLKDGDGRGGKGEMRDGKG